MDASRPTLIIHTVYFPTLSQKAQARGDADPEQEAARALGETLYETLTRPMGDALGKGAGIPVRIATHYKLVDFDEAAHVVAIPVLGKASGSLAGVQSEASATLKAWHQEGHSVLPVAVDDAWKQIAEVVPNAIITRGLDALSVEEGASEEEHRRDALRRAHALRQEIILGVSRSLTGGPTPHMSSFISHAKADLKQTDNLPESIQSWIKNQTTGDCFFDKTGIHAGENLAKAIREHAGQGILIIIRGDAHSSRSWCQQEVLIAKQKGLPILTIEVLTSGEVRSNPYAGNGPTTVWRRGAPIEPIITRAMVEGLRVLHFKGEAQRTIQQAHLPMGTHVLTRHPELLDLAHITHDYRGPIPLLHPDPEISVPERDLLKLAEPRLRLITPTTAFRGTLGEAISAPLAHWQIGFSLSDSPDLGGPNGIVAEHLTDAISFVARSLISTGASLGYGGDFRRYGFTPLLRDLIRDYNQTSKAPADFLHSYLGAPIPYPENAGYLKVHHLGQGTAEDEALLDAPPKGSGWPHPARAALYFSDMRRLMAQKIQARIVLGGQSHPKVNSSKDDGYGGRYPGVVEEAWRSLEIGQPLYVVGGFGGAAGLVAELIEQAFTDAPVIPPLMREETHLGKAWFKALTEALNTDPDVERLGLPRTMEDLAEAIMAGARTHLAPEACEAFNGLTWEQNRHLARTTDPLTIATLILTGLTNVQTQQSHGTLTIELINGDISTPRDLDLLVFSTFEDIPIGGAGLTIDELTDGAATRARAFAGHPTEVATPKLDTRYLMAANLGQSKAFTQDIAATITAASTEVARIARQHGFRKIGVVTFGGNVAKDYRIAAPAMLKGLKLAIAPDTGKDEAGRAQQVVWYEHRRDASEQLKEVLEAGGTKVSLHVPQAPINAVEPNPQHRATTFIRTEMLKDDFTTTVLCAKTTNALTPVYRTAMRAFSRPNKGDDRSIPQESLQKIGEGVAKLLFKERHQEVLEAIDGTKLVIVHDEGASAVPYEALTLKGKNGQWRTPATEVHLSRRLSAPGIPSGDDLRLAPRDSTLDLLLIVDPRDDLSAARKEAKAIRLQLGRVDVNVNELKGKGATRDAVMAALNNPTLDVVHYGGHAFYHGPGLDESGLKLADGRLTLRDLQALKSIPRVAVFNACEAARMRSDAPASVDPSLSFAEFFLRVGIEAYLGTYWEVNDVAAGKFAKVLYTQLAKGESLAEAILQGRRALKEADLTDWANYVLYGNGDFSLKRRQA